MATVPCVRYRTTVSEGAIAAIHGSFDIIDEVFIPSHNVIFNVDMSGKTHAFTATAPRNDLQASEAVVPLSLADSLRALCDAQDAVKLQVKALNPAMLQAIPNAHRDEHLAVRAERIEKARLRNSSGEHTSVAAAPRPAGDRGCSAGCSIS